MKKQLLLFLFAVLPLLAMADKSGKCGTGVTYTYYESSNKLVISGSGAMVNYEYSVNSTPWYSYRDKIKTIVIAPYVTSIGNSAFHFCTNLTSVTISNSVTSIGDYAFNNCTNLTSVTIPNSVKSIGTSAFRFCSGLTSITIPNSITSMGRYVFSGCTGLTSVTILYGVTSIGESAFANCSNLTSITIPNSMKSIEERSFDGCSGLTSINIPNSVTTIGSSAFNGCSSLTSINIPNSVTTIGSSAFNGCSGLTSVTIPNSVTSIGISPFSGCPDLTSIIVEDGNSKYDSRGNCNAIIETESNKLIQGCKTTAIPNSVTSIGSSAFDGCSGLTSVTIPNSVTSIGSSAFSNCSYLVDVTLNSNSVASANRTSSSSMETIFGNQVTNLIFGDEVTSIGDYAFYRCSNLKNITIPNSVTTIGGYAFEYIGYAKIILGDNIASIGSWTFDSDSYLYTKHKTKTLFKLWNSQYKEIYEQETSESLAPPSLKSSRTQTSYNVIIDKMYSDYTYELNGEKVTNNTIEYKNLYPGYYENYTLSVKYYDMSYTCSSSISTQSLSPSVKLATKTASSLSVNGKRTKGDAEISKITISLNGKTIEGENIAVTGLNPNTSYKATYTITIKYGENLKYTRDYTASSDFKTDALTLTTLQPKVISLGNAIVAATANVDDEEKNVGFEWRRTDWSSDFASNTGTAYLFEGAMEGYIRNLNTDKLWKYRPYYLADNGTYYYGDWIGLDPTNISYFEPTVHTYSQIGVKGNTALIKGYALGGSDDITVQGFKYWKNAGSGSNRVSSTDIPGTANTVEASGTIMEVSLSNLDYESSYSYVAFATTSKGTYYGEIKTFDTDSDPTGINGIKVDNATTASVHEIARYNMHGRRITTAEKGINIIRMSDGTSRKVVVK